MHFGFSYVGLIFLTLLMGHSDPEITMSLYTHTDYDYVEGAFRKVLGI